MTLYITQPTATPVRHIKSLVPHKFITINLREANDHGIDTLILF